MCAARWQALQAAVQAAGGHALIAGNIADMAIIAERCPHHAADPALADTLFQAVRTVTPTISQVCLCVQPQALPCSNYALTS